MRLLNFHSSYVRRGESGAVAISFVIISSLVLLCIVIGLDTGRLFLEQRRLQTVADNAAMEAVARSGSGGGGDAGALAQLAEESAARNGFVVGDRRSLQVERGSVSQQDGLRVFAADAEGGAVRVVARHEVRTSLLANLAALMPGSEVPAWTPLRAEAVASRGAFAAFSAGTRLLGLDTESSPLLGPLLGGLLGTHLDLDVLSPGGLLDVGLSLLELVEGMALVGVDLTAVGLDGVLQAGVTVAELLDVSVAVLQQRVESGELGSADLALLRDLQSAARNGSAELQQISLEQLLRLRNAEGEVPRGALDVDLRLGDLLGVALMAANRGNGLSLELGAGRVLNSLGSQADNIDSMGLVVRLGIIEPPQIAIGPAGRLQVPEGDRHWKTEVTSPQLSLVVGARLNLVLAELDLGLRVDAGSGKAVLESLQMGADGQQQASLLAKPALAAVHLGSLQSLQAPFYAGGSLDAAGIESAPIEPIAVRLLGSESTGSLAAVTIAASSVAGQGGDMVVRESDPQALFEGPPWPASPTTVTGASGDALGGLISSLLGNLDIRIHLLGGDKQGSCGLLGLGCVLDWVVNEVVLGVLNPVVNLLSALLTPLVTALGNLVIDPLLRLLGVQLGSMELQVLDVQMTEVELVL